ncbi:MAG: VWA domain-containing protein [Chloroflexota bacterium]
MSEAVTSQDFHQSMLQNLNQTVQYTPFTEIVNQVPRREFGSPTIGDLYDADIGYWGIIGLSPEDGTVILTDIAQTYYIMTTIIDPADEYGFPEHPTPGAREWGHTNNSDGTTTFYTRGISRTGLGILDYIDDIHSAQSEAWNLLMIGIGERIVQLGGIIEGLPTSIVVSFDERQLCSDLELTDVGDIVDLDEIESDSTDYAEGLLDLIFVIDTTSSMRDDIDEVKANALAIIDDVAASRSNWQIGVVTYRDVPRAPFGEPSDYQVSTELGFSTDRSEITSAINRITVGGGNNFRESVYAGLMQAIEFPWRNGAKKAIILMGDAPPHDPEPDTGFTMDDVLLAAFNVDPANIYPLLIANDSATRTAFQQMADGSSGRLFNAATAEDVVDTILDTVIAIAYTPELSSLLQPDDPARVFTTEGDPLNMRSGAGLDNTVVERLSNGDIVTIIDGPIYADTYIWWNIQSPSGAEGWSVEAADGITTLVPISFDGVETGFTPPENRTLTPDDARLLTNGRGLTDGSFLNAGEFQVEWYCGNDDLNVSNDNDNWFCLNDDRSLNYTLSITDFDTICKATYNNASAFAVQDGDSEVPAYSWRCYGPSARRE